MNRGFVLVVLLGAARAAAACGGNDDGGGGTQPAPAPAPTMTATCGEGTELAGGVCQPIVTTSTCAPGTRAAIGSKTCVAVGTSACAAGFTKHTSGWGCVPVLPATACTGATRDALGSTTCVAVGSCSAAFPPAGATIIVDATLADGAVDATHFKSLAAAVDAAPANATIAVAPGTYAENVSVKRKVTIVGQCAEKVILDAPITTTTSAATAAIAVGADFGVSGVTVRGGTIGLDVAPQVKVSVADAVLEQNLRAGISATDSAVVDVMRSVIRGTKAATKNDTTNGVFVDVDAKVTLTDSAVSGAADGGIGATGKGIIALTRSIIRDGVKRPDGVGGEGARAYEGGLVSLDTSAIVNSIGEGVIVGMTKGSAKMAHSSIVGTKPDLRFPGGFAIAASVSSTGIFDASDTTFADNAFSNVVADHEDTHATLQGCVVVGTTPSGQDGFGIATSAANGASVTVKSSAFVGNTGMAMYALHKGSSVDLTDSLVSTTALTPGGSTGLSAGHGGTALAVIDAAPRSLVTSTIIGSHELAIGALGAGTTLLLDRTYVSDTKPNGGALFGHALLGEKGAAVTVKGSIIEKSTGIAMAFAGGAGTVQGSSIRGNAVGIHVQAGSTLMTGAATPSALDPLEVFVSDDTSFDGNTTRVGSGVVPLPTLLSPPQ